MKKKILSCCLAIICLISGLTACNREDNPDDPVNENATRLDVYTFDGGVGSEWLEKVAERFEKEYENEVFESGKKGVDVRVGYSKDLMLTTLPSQKYSVIFTEQVPYNDLISQKLILDISDIVADQTLEDVSGGKDKAKIADKLNATQKNAFTAIDGKHYVLPHYETYSGITYDKKVFGDYGFYLKAGGGWTSVDDEKSVGPDGIKNTHDDGLPSSYEELYMLMDRMSSLGVSPFIWAGGLPQYTDHLLTGLYANYTGAEEFMLNFNYGKDSLYKGPGFTDIVKDFDSNGNPVIESGVEISPETGYLVYRQAGRYYAIKTLEKILSDVRYRAECMSGIMTHLDAQTEFVYSDLENKPIAMLIEGSYWYNEAADAFRRSENTYKDKAKNRQFAFMPLPVQAKGQVTEGHGKKGTLTDTNSSFAFINANVAEDPVKTKLSKLFLKYCYTDESLVEFTVTTGIPKGMKYDLSDETYNLLSPYSRSLFDMKRSCDIVYPYSDNKIYMYNPTLLLGSNMYQSVVKDTPYLYPYTALTAGVTAEQYFKGAFKTENEWKTKYSDYFKA